MKLRNIDELNGFLNAVDKCKKDVYLMSVEGDKLNLKSLFSRYISMGKLLSENGDSLELFCDSKEDEANFYEFFRLFPEVA